MITIHAYRPKRDRSSSLTFHTIAFNRRDSVICANAVKYRVSGCCNG